jgi:uncharacterized protein (DUF1330 family)
MSETKATLVVTAIPNADAMEDMQAYSTELLSLLMGHGGSLMLRGKTDKITLGKVTFGMLLEKGFDSAETIEQLFETLEYKALILYHDRAFSIMDTVISAAS